MEYLEFSELFLVLKSFEYRMEVVCFLILIGYSQKVALCTSSGNDLEMFCYLRVS